MNHRLPLLGSAALVIVLPLAAFAVTATARPAPARHHRGRHARHRAQAGVGRRSGRGRFTLARRARIVAAPGAGAAAELAVASGPGRLPAPGDRLPAAHRHRPPRPGDIVLAIGDPGQPCEPATGPRDTSSAPPPSGARIEAPTAHGLYNGIQTFRQLLPAWINSPAVMPGPWTAPVVTITDYPALPLPGPAARHRPALRAPVRGREAHRPGRRVQDRRAAPAPQRRPGLPAGDQRLPEADRRSARRGSVGTGGRADGPRRLLDPGAVQGRRRRCRRALHHGGARGRLPRPQQRDHHVRVQRHR